MNGLEAIELMKQGKILESVVVGGTPYLLKICGNDFLWIFKGDYEKGSNEWKKEVSLLLDREFKEYIEPKLLTGWERSNGKDDYFVIGSYRVCHLYEHNGEYDDGYYQKSNYFSTKEKAEEINFKQTLFRKLQRFSDENGGNEIDWDDDQLKYCITYDSKKKRVVIKTATGKQFGQVYFHSYQASLDAARMFHDDLIKYFTHDWGGENE